MSHTRQSVQRKISRATLTTLSFMQIVLRPSQSLLVSLLRIGDSSSFCAWIIRDPMFGSTVW